MTTLVGTGRLIRFILRRDRVLLPVWLIWITIIPIVTVSAFESLYPTQDLLDTAVEAFGTNPAFRALLGPVFGSSIGSLVAWRASLVVVVVGVVAVLAVIRHTRVEEESGRRELIGSTVVGRHAPLAAALIVVIGASVVLGLLLTAGLSATGLPVAGSLALGLQFTLVAVVFAGVGAVAAQLTETAGGARAIGLSTLALFYVIRAAGDAGSDLGWLSWLSPIGWGQQLRPFGGERWWVLGLLLVTAALLTAAASALSGRRDVGGGLFPPRLGPAVGSPMLRSPLALAWRVHRGILGAWTAAFLVLGAVYGSVAEGVGDLLRDNPDLADIFARLGQGEGTIIDLYLAGVMGMLGMIAAAYGVQAAFRMKLEEDGQRLDPVLATAVSRRRWMGSHLGFVVVGPVVVLAAGGLGVGVSYAAIAGDPGQVLRAVGAAMVNAPAAWVLAAVVVALFGLLPEFSGLGWAAFGAAVFISILGALLRLSHWVMDLSPFTHTPALPGADFELLPLVGLAVVAVVVAAAGVNGFRSRDLR